MQTMIIRLLACVLVASAVAGCGAKSPPQVTIVNDSTSAVTDILLYGNGFKQVINRIEPNDSKTVTVVPAAESSVTMEAVTPSRYITAKDVGFIEPSGGFRIKITITADYNIETGVDLNAPP